MTQNEVAKSPPPKLIHVLGGNWFVKWGCNDRDGRIFEFPVSSLDDLFHLSVLRILCNSHSHTLPNQVQGALSVGQFSSLIPPLQYLFSFLSVRKEKCRDRSDKMGEPAYPSSRSGTIDHRWCVDRYHRTCMVSGHQDHGLLCFLPKTLCLDPASNIRTVRTYSSRFHC